MTATIDPQHAADLYEDEDGAVAGPWTRVAAQQRSTTRWLGHYYLVVSDTATGALYGVPYALGLTEYQDHDLPWEDTDDPLSLIPLVARQVTTTVYRKAEVSR